MDLFNDISFINEGQQAEEYKARKAKEKEEAEKKEQERMDRRKYSAGNTAIGRPDKLPESLLRQQKVSEKIVKDFGNRVEKAKSTNKDHFNSLSKSREEYLKARKNAVDAERNMNNLYYNRQSAEDALNRHMRRHPDQYKESGLFESVDFLNDDHC